MNYACIVGRITKDPELKKSSQGNDVLRFVVAANRLIPKEKQHTNSRTADFIPCIAWNRRAKSIAKNCKKGSRVALHGTLQTHRYDPTDGSSRRYVMVFMVDYFEILFKKTSNRNISSDHLENTNASQNNTIVEPPSVNQEASHIDNKNKPDTQDFPFF